MISTRKLLGIFPFLSSNRGKLYLSAHFLLLISCQAEVTKLQENRPDQVPAEEHAQLKDKVRDLENCLHEMQEEFEEVVFKLLANNLSCLDLIMCKIYHKKCISMYVKNVREKYM